MLQCHLQYVIWDLIMCQFQCTAPFPLSPPEDAVRHLVKAVTFEVLTDSKHNLYEVQKYADADMDRACIEIHVFT